MIPKAITAPFRWWAKHPWMVFWGIILPAPLSKIIFLSNDLLLSNDILIFVHAIFLLVLPIAWILSFSQEARQRSKVRVVLAVAAFVIPIILIIISPMFSHHSHYNPESDVKANLKNAATAQEAYWVDHHTYTSNIDGLKGYGYNQSSNVTMGASATETTFIITGTVKKGCEAKTGVWFIDSTTGDINGTRCR